MEKIQWRRGADYVIWSNEHNAWWGPNNRGYANRLGNAGHYTRDEALKICSNARGGWPWEGTPPEMPVLLKDAIQCYPIKPLPWEPWGKSQRDYNDEKTEREREFDARIDCARAAPFPAQRHQEYGSGSMGP
ncbi:MAG: hypothetical protein GY807_24105 [Gammaproteobacteria bacterium]|nr:hypothetical protein [Gammaproteobacteria bacterium]